MSVANLGSISDRIFNRIDNIPTSISGTEMLAIIYEQVIYMEQFTGLQIGSTQISERFQPALIALSAAEVMKYIETQGADVSSFHLGDLSVSKSSSSSQSEMLQKDGLEKLKRIGRQFPKYRSY